jgi:glycosyltransferase involved in cell wall biosynthesis
MKSLLCHEFYQQFGGEDHSYLDEAALLRAHGHQVVEYTRHNKEIDRRGRVAVSLRSVSNHAVYRELRELIRRERPDIMHCTNIFPLITPSAYQAAHDEGVPVIQALRNYRMLCPSATLMRDGHVCESCIDKIFPWPAVRHACYHKSRMGSAVVAAMLGIHNLKGTWSQVDRFYTPSQFARNVFIRAGMPPEKIDVKLNFVNPDPGPGRGDGGYALFVGRLSPEKGISTLLSAWSELQVDIPLRIIGDGPCRDAVQKAAANDKRIVHLGEKSSEEVVIELRAATCLVMPSVWYETFGRTIIEAFSVGTPVIASRLGAMEELVAHQETGLLFEPGSSSALSQAVRELYRQRDLGVMRARARREYENKYTAEQSYDRMMLLYERTIAGKCYGRRPDAHAVQQLLPNPLYHPIAPSSVTN